MTGSAIRLATLEEQKRPNGIVKDVLDTGGALSLPGVVSETALDLPVDLTLQEWAATGEVLNQIHKSWKWWFGDWLNYGEDHWPEEYAQYMDITDFPEQSIANIRSVARNIPPAMRRRTLAWSSHACVVPLIAPRKEMTQDERAERKGLAMKVIEQADEEQWPREYLRQVVKQGGNADLIPPAVLEEPSECDCYCVKSDYCKECGHPWGS